MQRAQSGTLLFSITVLIDYLNLDSSTKVLINFGDCGKTLKMYCNYRTTAFLMQKAIQIE